MAKRNLKVTMEEWQILELKRIAKERWTSVSAMMQARMVDEMRAYEKEFGPLNVSKVASK
jgi:hypothetical protein